MPAVVAPHSRQGWLFEGNGNWQITELNGYDYTTSDYSIVLKFKSSGDLDFCYEDATYSYCDTQAWRWQDANQSAIILTEDDDEEVFDIVILDETKLEGTVTDGTTSFEVKFVKVI